MQLRGPGLLGMKTAKIFGVLLEGGQQYFSDSSEASYTLEQDRECVVRLAGSLGRPVYVCSRGFLHRLSVDTQRCTHRPRLFVLNQSNSLFAI